ncbi:hypothetical protein RDV89_14020 [Nocardioides zeae]|uniref:ATP-grasp domain-containing protein n=1 Tax=Nocardioides imazamoxiresistens TaxID=3231893 RepID=A0ABU3PZL3_9ACTN|nr:hypothetical protein [Nocardioides zeae]MDT9594195.1 hypothetical protein [Nocardioides zeae]
MSTRPRVLLATFQLMPQGEEGGHLLVAELEQRGIEAAWAVWDDPAVDWAAADLVAVRATWDYHRRLGEFLDWARATAAVTTVLNGPDVFAWNAVKDYLVGLGEDVAVVPTVPLDDRTLVPVLTEVTQRWGSAVVKPATGAGGVGVVVATGPLDPVLEQLTAGPWVAQPLVESVRTRGETSVFVLEGRAVVQVEKVPAAGEIRVHGHLGGTTRGVPVAEQAGAVAEAAVRAAAARHAADLAYARVDLLEHEGRLVVSELELIEPGLYLEVDTAMAARFADLVAARLR